MTSSKKDTRRIPRGTCPACRGAGKVMKYRSNGAWFPIDCYACGGTGQCPHHGRDLIAFTLRAMRSRKPTPRGLPR